MAHLANQSVRDSLRITRGIKDHKRNVLALLRNHALDLNGILAQEEFLESEKSELADLLSWGLFGKFLERAKEKCLSKLRWVDVRRLGISSNLENLIKNLFKFVLEIKFIFFHVLFQFPLPISSL